MTDVSELASVTPILAAAFALFVFRNNKRISSERVLFVL